MNYKTFFILILLIPALFSCRTEKKELDNLFYAFNNCMRTLPAAPEGFEAQAQLVKEIGFDGLAGHVEDNYYELRAAMDKVGIEMPEMYIGMHIKEGLISYHTELHNILKHSRDRDLLVALHLLTSTMRHPKLFSKNFHQIIGQ